MDGRKRNQIDALKEEAYRYSVQHKLQSERLPMKLEIFGRFSKLAKNWCRRRRFHLMTVTIGWAGAMPIIAFGGTDYSSRQMVLTCVALMLFCMPFGRMANAVDRAERIRN